MGRDGMGVWWGGDGVGSDAGEVGWGWGWGGLRYRMGWGGVEMGWGLVRVGWGWGWGGVGLSEVGWG